MTPEAGRRHFTDKRIFIEFDEYIQLKDQNKEFYTSPLMKTKPTLVVKGRGVRIDIKDTLPENQTFSLNFGSAVRDNNEGNILYGLRYVFSTGSGIDSMMMTGYTADAMKGDSIGKSFIFFFAAAAFDSVQLPVNTPVSDSLESDSIPRTPLVPRFYSTAGYDSLMLLGKPSAVGRAEGNGIFIAQNLKPIPYRVYAFQDNNDNQSYDPGTDRVGFIDTLYNPAEMEPFAMWRDEYRKYPTADPQIYFRMFTDGVFLRHNLTGTERPGRHQAILRFSAPFPSIDTLMFDSIPEDKVIREYMTSGRDTISLWFDMPPEALPDTIKGRISYLKHDSLNNLVPVSQPLRLAWRYVESREEEREREKEEKEREKAAEAGEEYTPPEKPNPFRFKVDAAAEVNPEKSIPIQFDLPLAALDSTRISLTAVTNPDDPKAVPFRVVRDTMNIRLWTITADWNEDDKYRLLVPSGAFINIAGESNDTLKADFAILPRSKSATIIAKVTGKTPESKYVLQVVNASNKVEKEITNVSTGTYNIYYIPEGEVRIRVLEDMNGNGKWDTGNLIERRQPERSEFYVGPTGNQLVPTRLNWEVDVELNMSQIFAPVSIEKVRYDLQRAEDARVTKWLEEKAKRDEERRKQEAQQGQGGGGLGIGGALSGAKQQMQSTVGGM
jgi:uncharacterized protein (DUF2141 family)